MAVKKLSSENFDSVEFFGDKLVIHKCVIDAAIKRIKNDPDPYGNGDVQHGKICILEEMLGLIKRGHKIELERWLNHQSRK